MEVKMRINNKSSKPDNIVLKENMLLNEISAIQTTLPSFLKDYFIYLKTNVSITTRKAYLSDIHFFFEYLIKEEEKNGLKSILELQINDIKNIKARDINYYLSEYCSRYIKDEKGIKVLYENHNRSLSRKKSALVSMFKFLYKNEQIDFNIIDGLNSIKLPKPQPDAIKKLEVDEMMKLLEIVQSGEKLTIKEKTYWEKTRYRDKAILILFLTYGLRLKELQELNISSLNFSRGEFKIYRKRGKESLMPLNNTVIKAVKEYIELERPKISIDNDALFLSLQKKRMTERNIRELVKKYTSIVMNTTKSKGYSPHKLRATAASSLIEFGFSIYDVQNLLDHDNVTTTQLYAAHRKKAKRELISQFELEDKKIIQE
jgi:site-specific recombinase XerD